jgi:hypothetical protein
LEHPSEPASRVPLANYAELLSLSKDGNTWLRFASLVYRDYPLIKQSAIARCVCGAREFLEMESPFPSAIHFTHEEPSYRAEYDRIFRVPLFLGSHMNALLLDKGLLSFKVPQAIPFLAQSLTANAEALLKDLERSW